MGTSAAGLKDIRTTPLDPAAAGVECMRRPPNRRCSVFRCRGLTG